MTCSTIRGPRISPSSTSSSAWGRSPSPYPRSRPLSSKGSSSTFWGDARWKKPSPSYRTITSSAEATKRLRPIVRELLQTQKPFVVVDPSEERLARMKEIGEILWVQGDPSEDDVLEKAGIKRAKGIICSLPTDEANLFVLVTAKGLNPGHPDRGQGDRRPVPRQDEESRRRQRHLAGLLSAGCGWSRK